MGTGTIGTVFNIQRYSLHDGPGIRTTVFLKGCPLACVWCHNPEGRAAEPELRLLPTRCIGCGLCREPCPQQVAWSGRLPYQTPHCSVCGACVEACPVEAREVAGRCLTVPQLAAELRRDRVFFDHSGGGVTLSGGEPLLQADFVRELLDRLRDEAIHAALDTCGYAPTETFLEVARRADLVLYDIKTLDDAVHRRYTGVSNALILENLRALVRVHVPVWIRVPLIAGVNTDRGMLARTARFVAGLGGIQQVNLLPYHAWGTGKSSREAEAAEERFSELSESDIQQALEVFQRAGLTTYIGG